MYSIPFLLCSYFFELMQPIGMPLTDVVFSSEPLQHVPRINTYFPTYSDATMDHHRLLDRFLLMISLALPVNSSHLFLAMLGLHFFSI